MFHFVLAFHMAHQMSYSVLEDFYPVQIERYIFSLLTCFWEAHKGEELCKFCWACLFLDVFCVLLKFWEFAVIVWKWVWWAASSSIWTVSVGGNFFEIEPWFGSFISGPEMIDKYVCMLEEIWVSVFFRWWEIVELADSLERQCINLFVRLA